MRLSMRSWTSSGLAGLDADAIVCINKNDEKSVRDGFPNEDDEYCHNQERFTRHCTPN